MGEPSYMQFVRWPACSDCNASGVRLNPKTGWPEECARCKSGRELAIKDAQSFRRREEKAGRL